MSNQFGLLKEKRFAPFFGVQFLGALPQLGLGDLAQETLGQLVDRRVHLLALGHDLNHRAGR